MAVPLVVHDHGERGPLLVAVHGGPGAPGSLAPLARELGRDHRVLEPWQRAGGQEPLTVARHVADLHALVQARCAPERPALLGHSWGAMLVLAYAAAHPEAAGPLILVGCGTFDAASRARFRQTVHERLGAAGRAELTRLHRGALTEARLAAVARLLEPVYSYHLLPGHEEPDRLDAAGHDQTWNDMLRLQAEGVYPAAFAAVSSPVLMLHGEYDPHPGPMIRDSLAPYLSQLNYVELPRCGHEPWREAEAREAFLSAVRAWLAAPRP